MFHLACRTSIRTATSHLQVSEVEKYEWIRTGLNKMCVTELERYLKVLTKTLKLTSVILPEAFDVDDVRLEVWLRRLHVHVVSNVVHAVFEAAVLTICPLQV